MGERISAHTKTVLGILAAERCHLTAEEILQRAEGMGTATVYRALDTLTEKGQVRRLALGRKSAVYEYIRDTHMHFVCERCGGVFDIAADLTGMVREAARCCGHTVSGCEITARGLCAACAQREEMQ